MDDAETIAAHAQDMSEFLNESQTTERRAFIETFVKEVVVMPGSALLRYTIPMPVDGLMPGRNAEEMALDGPGRVIGLDLPQFAKEGRSHHWKLGSIGNPPTSPPPLQGPIPGPRYVLPTWYRQKAMRPLVRHGIRIVHWKASTQGSRCRGLLGLSGLLAV